MNDLELVRAARYALVGRLARGIAHELNNPLFVVLGLVELVLRDLEPGSKAYERLSLALSTGDEIKELVTTVLDVARDEPVEPAPLSLEQPAHAAAAVVRRLALTKDVEVVECYPSKPVRVEARAAELRQLFLTLLALAGRDAAGPASVTIDVVAEGSEAVARIWSELEVPADAGFDLDAAGALARRNGGSLAAERAGPLQAELRLPLLAGE